MSIVLDRDALRDAAVGIATALPVVAVAYYTVRGSDPHPALPPGEMVGFDLPQRFQNRVGSGLIQLLGRVPVAGAKVWVGESTLIAADGSFLRSFGPGVLAALICISLNGSPVWLALSLIFLFAAIGQLITYVTITAMTRRAALSAAGKRTMHTSRSADTTADRDILDKLGWLYASDNDPPYHPVLRLVRRRWVRLPPVERETELGSSGGDNAPFRALAVMVVGQLTLAALVLACAVILVFYSRT